MTAPDLVDWRLAVTTARTLAPAGPAVSPELARSTVAELRELAERARERIVEVTRMRPLGDGGRVVVVDRPRWAAGTADGFKAVLDPVVETLSAKRKLPGPAATAVGARVTGLELGVLLAFLSTKVLGQYEVFLPPEAGAGRLSLIAPTIVEVERELGVDPTDFRLWVCLHEMTHLTQFTSVPWLRDHLLSEIHAYVEASELDAAALVRRAVGAARSAADASGRDQPFSLLELVQAPAQRVVLDRVTALMSLLEGHADWAMDAAGEGLVGSVADIRRKFDRRRRQIGAFDRLIRQLIGFDAKMRQYAEGGAFVRGVVEIAGVDGLNRVWESPLTLPTRAELADPAGWVGRVVGHHA